MRRLIGTPITYVKTDGKENIYNFMLKRFCLSKPMVVKNAALTERWVYHLQSLYNAKFWLQIFKTFILTKLADVVKFHSIASSWYPFSLMGIIEQMFIQFIAQSMSHYWLHR